MPRYLQCLAVVCSSLLFDKTPTCTPVYSLKTTLCDRDETRTRNLLIRSQTPYPLGHAAGRHHNFIWFGLYGHGKSNIMWHTGCLHLGCIIAVFHWVLNYALCNTIYAQTWTSLPFVVMKESLPHSSQGKSGGILQQCNLHFY